MIVGGTGTGVMASVKVQELLTVAPKPVLSMRTVTLYEAARLK